MRIIAVLVVLLLTAGPGLAQSSQAQCKSMLDTVSRLSTAYRALLDDLNGLAVNNIVSSLAGEEKAAAQEMADAHQAVRPVLTVYVQRLEDLTYALQMCIR